MNRKILFRAKRKDGEGWVSGYYVYDYKYDTHYIFRNTIVCPNCINDNRQDYSLIYHEIYADTLCQYTGLTDKNGNKIWENDIVTVPDEEDFCTIKWDNEKAEFAFSMNRLFVADFNFYSWNDVTVKGNAFDNPELLGV